MLDSMNFDIPPASTVVVDRKQGVRAFPTSASSLQIGGTRTCRIRLGGTDWVHPESVRLQFVVNNTSTTKPLKPATGPWGVWGQVRLLSGGNELDNVPIYSRFHSLHGWSLLTQEQQYAESSPSTDGEDRGPQLETNQDTQIRVVFLLGALSL